MWRGALSCVGIIGLLWGFTACGEPSSKQDGMFDPSEYEIEFLKQPKDAATEQWSQEPHLAERGQPDTRLLADTISQPEQRIPDTPKEEPPPRSEPTIEPTQDASTPEPPPETPPTPREQLPTPCPTGMICVDKFPYHHAGDTSISSRSQFHRYACKPSADESGPEVVYRLDIKQAGFLSVAVYDGAGVDIDVHILSKLETSGCLSRGNHHAKADVKPGIYYVVADTFSKNGQHFSGRYQLDIGLYVPSKGPCGMQQGVMHRVRDGGKALKMPATGPVVMEAHLVTQDEPPPYPTTATDKLKQHYALSQSKTGFVMYRSQVWAPLEGGSFYGAGIWPPKYFPTVHESWYVNMYWTSSSRPKRGTRMILRVPGTNRAVVVAAGYETGPVDLSNIGGTPEETHFYLGTTHRSILQLGIATDQTLPFGPRICQ